MTGRADFSIRVLNDKDNTDSQEMDTGYKDVVTISMELTGDLLNENGIQDIVMSAVSGINSCMLSKQMEEENKTGQSEQGEEINQSDEFGDFKVQSMEAYKELLDSGFKENFENGEVLSL